MEVLIEVLTFGVVVACTLAVMRLAQEAWLVRRRLGQQGGAGAAAVQSPLMKPDSVQHPLLRWVQSSTSLSDAEDRQKLRRALYAAGFDSPSGPVWYTIIRYGLAIGMAFGFILFEALVAHKSGGLSLVVGSLLFCAAGLFAPYLFVRTRANSRREQMEHEFPDALDLMVVCVEAGLGLETAFIRVGEETHASHPHIARELNRVSDELRAGRGRAEALRGMADRTSIDAVKSFVALLIQTDALGTSIGQTLRSYAVEMREHRFLNAEHKAMRIPVLMTIPLVACILPVIVTALLLPPVLDVMRTLMPALSGR